MQKAEGCNCDGCSLNEYGYVPWQEPIVCQYDNVLFVGQAPGSTEAITKVPFTGRAGKMCWRVMNEAGLQKSRLHITNLVTCAPPEDRAPTHNEVIMCSQHLYREIAKVKPKLIVALGEHATYYLTGKSRILSIRGKVFPLLSMWGHECDVLCTLHPSFVMRQRMWIEIVVKDLVNVHSLLASERIEVVDETFDFTYDPSPSQLAEELEKARGHLTSFDIETPGELNPRKAKIIGISYSYDPHKALALDFYEGDERWEISKRFLEDKDAKKVGQNAQFDTACLFTNGVVVRNLDFDTRLVEHLLSSDNPADLDFLRGKYTKIEPYKPAKREMRSIGEWEKERRLEYCCYDAVVTLQVAQAQQKLMTHELSRVLYEIDLPLVDIVNDMERKGVLVDQESLAYLYMQMEPRIAEIKAKWFDPIGMNPNSNVAIARYLETENASEETLEKVIKQGHPKSDFIKAVLEIRGLSKVASTFLMGVFERLENGRIHTHYDIAGTGTGGRLSSKNPNLQNIPEYYRVIYIADPGGCLIKSDYSQLEVKILAVVSGDPRAIDEVFYKGINIHHMMCKEIFKRKWDDLDDQEKLKVKTVVFGTAYGRSPRSIAMEFGISTEQAAEWQGMCVHQYPGFLRYQERQKATFQSTGMCYTMFGRRRSVKTPTQSMNTPIQGTAGDVTKTALIRAHKKGLDLRLTTHDDIVIHAPLAEKIEAANALKEAMEAPIGQLDDHMFTVKIKAGPNWRDVESI